MTAALQPRFLAAGNPFEVPVDFQIPDDSAIRPAPVGGFASYPKAARAEQTVVGPDSMFGRVLVAGRTLEAGASATYGDALKAATSRGLMLPVTANTRRTTLAAGLVSNTVSRFSSHYGRAADSIESFELATADGKRRLVRRPDESTNEENDSLFRAVPGGFGFLGAIGRIRTRLMPLSANTAWTTPKVETVTSTSTTFDGLVDALVFDHMLATDAIAGGLSRATADVLSTWAMAGQDGRSILFRSQYVAGDRVLSPCLLNRPSSLLQRVRGLGGYSTLAGRLGWRLFWGMTARRRPSFIDTLDGFTFHAEGEWRTNDLLQRAGANPWQMRQSFLIPIRRREGDPGRRTKQFLGLAQRALEEAGVRVNPLQFVTVPADEYLLSASREREGVLVTLSSQGLSESAAGLFAQSMRRLSRYCADLGGRVQLERGMSVEQHVLQQMYGEALTRFRELKERFDPDGMVENPFVDRLLKR